jgi:hypothetical protein
MNICAAAKRTRSRPTRSSVVNPPLSAYLIRQP